MITFKKFLNNILTEKTDAEFQLHQKSISADRENDLVALVGFITPFRKKDDIIHRKIDDIENQLKTKQGKNVLSVIRKLVSDIEGKARKEFNRYTWK